MSYMQILGPDDALCRMFAIDQIKIQLNKGRLGSLNFLNQGANQLGGTLLGNVHIRLHKFLNMLHRDVLCPLQNASQHSAGLRCLLLLVRLAERYEERDQTFLMFGAADILREAFQLSQQFHHNAILVIHKF